MRALTQAGLRGDAARGRIAARPAGGGRAAGTVLKADKKNQAQRVAVETGAEEGALVEIKGLVAPGERVIVRGAERLEAGQKVRAVEAS